MSKFDGWVLKNKKGEFLMWAADWRRKDVVNKISETWNWKKIRERGYNLEIDELCIGFAFDEEGDFLGIFNWKE